MAIQEFSPYTEQAQNIPPMLIRAQDINTDLLQQIYSFYDMQSPETLGMRMGATITRKDAFPKEHIYTSRDLQWIGILYDWDHTILGIGELVSTSWPDSFSGHTPIPIYEMSSMTDEKHFKQGIGFRIAIELIQKAKDDGVYRIHTESTYNNIGSKKLIESLKEKSKIRDLFSRENPYTNSREHLLIL